MTTADNPGQFVKQARSPHGGRDLIKDQIVRPARSAFPLKNIICRHACSRASVLIAGFPAFTKTLGKGSRPVPQPTG